MSAQDEKRAVAAVAAFEAALLPERPVPSDVAAVSSSTHDKAPSVAPTPHMVRGSKKMPLGTQMVVWHDPESEAGHTDAEQQIQKEILTYYGMESLEGEKKTEMLRALYHGTCQTHQTILQSAQCEPVRAILQTLAMRWLSGLVPDETRATLTGLNRSRTLSNAYSGTSGVLGTSGTSGVLGTSGTSGVLGTSGELGTSGTSGTSGPFGTPSDRPVPYTYQRNGDYIVITMDESHRILCADLERMTKIGHSVSPLASSAQSFMEEAVAATASFKEEQVAQAVTAAQQAEREVQRAAEVHASAIANVQQLSAQLAEAQKATLQVTANRNESRILRNQARAQVADLQAQLEAAQQASEQARMEKEQAAKKATYAQVAAQAAQVASQQATEKAYAERNAAQQVAIAAQAERDVAQQEAQAAREEAKQREASLEASLQEITARSEAAARNAMQSTAADRARWEQTVADTRAEQARIQAALNEATAEREQRDLEYQKALKEKNIARKTVQLLQSQRNEVNTAAKERIAQLEREIQEHNDAAAAKLAELEQAHRATLRERNEKETREAAEQNAHLAALEANRNQAHSELREERERSLKTSEAARRSLIEQHAAALVSKNEAHAEQLRQQLEATEADYQQQLHILTEEAAAEKQKQMETHAAERAAWESDRKVAEQNLLQKEREHKEAQAAAIAAQQEKEKALAEAKAATNTAIATSLAAQQAAEQAAHANRANKEAALVAQRAAEQAATEAKAAQKEAEERATAAHKKAEEEQQQAREAADRAMVAQQETEAARKVQITLEAQQEELRQAAQDLEKKLEDATKAQQTMKAMMTKAAQNAATQTAAEREQMDRALQEAHEKAEEKEREATAFKTSLEEKTAAYETAQKTAEAERKQAQEQANAALIAERQKIIEIAQASKARLAAITEEMERIKEHHKAALFEKNATHAKEWEAHIKKMEHEKETEMTDFREKHERVVQNLQHQKDSQTATIASLTALQQDTEAKRKEAEKQATEAAENMVRWKEQSERLRGAHSNGVNAAQQQLAAAIAEARTIKESANRAAAIHKASVDSAIHRIAEVTKEKAHIEGQLEQMRALVAQRHGVIHLGAVPEPVLAFQPVRRESVTALIRDLTQKYFLPWRRLMRHPIALRVHDLRDSASLRTCLEAYPLVTLFSPLPEERVMETLLGRETFNMYKSHQEDVIQENETARTESASSNDTTQHHGGGNNKAMRIDMLLYYLIIGLRRAPIINQSDDFSAINDVVTRIDAFTKTHLEQNVRHIDRIQNTCGVELADEHNQDDSLLTFLYLSSKTPKLNNARFQYTIDPRYQRTLTLTYTPVPTPLYDTNGREIAKGTDYQTYHYGPFTKIYDPNMTSQTIAQDAIFVDAIENKLRRGEAVTVIGYGASGSGKTTTLVYAKHNGQPGLLAHVANRLIQTSGNASGFTQCRAIIYELDANESRDGQCRTFSSSSDKTLTRTVLDKTGKATEYTLPVTDCSAPTPFDYTVQNGTWMNNKQVPLEKEIVEYIDTKRNTAPTPNNPQSSRSHVICVLTFHAGEKEAVFVVCDFAGVENTFMCENPRVKETIGVKALVDPMVDRVLQDVKKEIQMAFPFVKDEALTFFRPSKELRLLTISDVETMNAACTAMLDEIKNTRITNYALSDPKRFNLPDELLRQILIKKDGDNYYFDMSGIQDLSFFKKMGPQWFPSSEHRPFHAIYTSLIRKYGPSIQQILEFATVMGVRDITDTNSFGSLLRLLTWYRLSKDKYSYLFQSLVTRAYDPSTTKIMTEDQIRAYPQRVLCEQRVKEGVFINDSLARLRAFIGSSIHHERTPPFIDECAPLQCDPHQLHCFGQKDKEDQDGGPLLSRIQPHIQGKKHTFCLFTVVNLSRDANNPPPTPYVDISPLLKVREALQPLLPNEAMTDKGVDPAFQLVEATMRKVLSDQDPIMIQFRDLRAAILPWNSDSSFHLDELLQRMITFNAMSTMGTIEFTDAMAKYGATQVTCAPSFVKQQIQQLEQGSASAAPSANVPRRGPVNSKTHYSSIALGGRRRRETTLRAKAARRTRKRRVAKSV